MLSTRSRCSTERFPRIAANNENRIFENVIELSELGSSTFDQICYDLSLRHVDLRGGSMSPGHPVAAA
jgi:hypothetical protein